MTTPVSTLVVQFDRIASRYGGRCSQFPTDGESIVKQVSAVIEQLSASPNLTSPLPPTYVDFVDSDKFNAFACELPGQAFIGLNRGLLSGLYDAFNLVLADGTIMAHAGFTEEYLREPARSAMLDELVADLPDEIQDDAGRYMTVVRWMYSRVLSRIALGFVVHHELAHILHGHSLLRSGADGYGIILESDRGLEKQALEMDADCAAVSQSLNSLVRMISASDVQPVLGCAFSNAPKAFLSWLVSIHLFFRLQVTPGPIFENICERSHPPPSIRQVYTGALLRELLISRINDPLFATGRGALCGLLEAMDSSGEWILLVENAYASARSETLDVDALLMAMSEEGVAHMDRLHKAWAAVYPKLRPLARRTLVKPQF